MQFWPKGKRTRNGLVDSQQIPPQKKGGKNLQKGGKLNTPLTKRCSQKKGKGQGGCDASVGEIMNIGQSQPREGGKRGEKEKGEGNLTPVNPQGGGEKDGTRSLLPTSKGKKGGGEMSLGLREKEGEVSSLGGKGKKRLRLPLVTSMPGGEKGGGTKKDFM